MVNFLPYMMYPFLSASLERINKDTLTIGVLLNTIRVF